MEELKKINPDFGSYQQLINFYQKYKECQYETIELSLTEFFAANMSSPLGGILDKLSENFNDIHFKNITEDIGLILLKNEFLSYYGYDKYFDGNNTTIKFLKLNLTSSRLFYSYVVKDLLNKSELLNLSSGLKKKMAEAIYEIFVNAQMHSETKNVYTCGQLYPKINTIHFTITDTGIGFKNRIMKSKNINLSSIDAIKWAVNGKNSTKENVPGGLGLTILKEFVDLNKGSIQIVSDDGFYQHSMGNDQFCLLDGSFPGTIVNLQFKTDDVSSYELIEDISLDDIF
jgi:anti-sigma regulatory factor (Ser/Thr protein kinase)